MLNHERRARAWLIAGACIGSIGVIAVILWAILNDSVDQWLRYESVGMSGTEQMSITSTGQVVIQHEKLVTVYQLPAAELATLRQQVAAADFFHQPDRYIEQDPQVVIFDQSINTFTLNEGGRHKSITLWDSAAIPAAVRTVEDTIFAIEQEALAAGQTTPRLLP